MREKVPVYATALYPEEPLKVAQRAGAFAREGFQQEQVAVALDEDAQVMSDTMLAEQLAGQPEDVQAEIHRINQEERNIALQVALMIPLLAGLLGLLNSFRMVRMPDPEPSGAAEGLLVG